MRLIRVPGAMLCNLLRAIAGNGHHPTPTLTLTLILFSSSMPLFPPFPSVSHIVLFQILTTTFPFSSRVCVVGATVAESYTDGVGRSAPTANGMHHVDAKTRAQLEASFDETSLLIQSQIDKIEQQLSPHKKKEGGESKYFAETSFGGPVSTELLYIFRQMYEMFAWV